MVNTYESVRGLEGRNSALTRRSDSTSAASLSMLLQSINYRYLLLVIVVCLIASSVATIASSQELPGNASTSGAAGFSNDWWASEPREASPAPQLVISMMEPIDFNASDSLRNLPAQSNGDRPAAARLSTVASLSTFSLTDMTLAVPKLSADNALPPAMGSFAFAQIENPSWGSLLADSQSLSEVSGASVHPLLQVNFAGWQLPVTLYTAPNRDEAVR